MREKSGRRRDVGELPVPRDRNVTSRVAVGQTGGAASETPTTNSAGTHNHGGTSVAAGPFTATATSDVQGAHNRGGSDGGTALTLAQLPAHDHGLGGRYVVTDASISGGATGQLMGGGSYPAGEYPLDEPGQRPIARTRDHHGRRPLAQHHGDAERHTQPWHQLRRRTHAHRHGRHAAAVVTRSASL